MVGRFSCSAENRFLTVPVGAARRYMRVMAATYVGKMMGDANMSYWGDQWAAEAVANFNLYGTLAEVRVLCPLHFIPVPSCHLAH
jgi:hypothetical protein